MTRRLSDGRIVTMAQKKSDASIKVGYVALNGSEMKMAFTGNLAELKKWLQHQMVLADKASNRAMVSDMCGTSYRAAREDMGL